MIRTRVGYCGGMLTNPTYHDLDDHSETIEIDYDPKVLSYEDLVAVFLTAHDPTQPHYSMQYRSAIFYRNEREQEAALGAIERASVFLGPIRTAVEHLDRFWLAEDYHQKYRLRADKALMAEFHRLCPTEADFVGSTAVARVNGWLDGYGDRIQIDSELPLTGLSEAGQASVRSQALKRERVHAR